MNRNKIEISIANSAERSRIYHMRHQVYATELGQHPENDLEILTDDLDLFNSYFIAKIQDEIIGFVSVTPPSENGIYSINKYFKREELPVEVNVELYEMRILTVLPEYRNTAAAVLLLWAAYRWIDALGGSKVLAIAKIDVLSFYLKLGFKSTDKRVQSGAVKFELIYGEISDINLHVEANLIELFSKLEGKCAWNLAMPFFKAVPCYHGGAFFDAIGDEFDQLQKKDEIINADVLDAWFSPAPEILQRLKEHMSWISRTSPPIDCGGMIRAIANARGVKPRNILPGAGSSDLIFLAFREWLDSSSRVLILDPTYGEYRHILEKLIGCHVDKLPLLKEKNYRVDLEELMSLVTNKYDLIVLVNPNSPTGQHISRASMEILLDSIPKSTRVWIDETYVEYVGTNQSMEHFAAKSENVIVCKSMSKVYALSGLRAAYLCASSYQLEALRAITPPWAVSLPAQIAAVTALQSGNYYQDRYDETHKLRKEFISDLKSIKSFSISDTCANFILCHLSPETISATELVARCKEHKLYIRDVGNMGDQFGDRVVRIAIKDRSTNKRIVEILKEVLL